jgi:hypothetical protein
MELGSVEIPDLFFPPLQRRAQFQCQIHLFSVQVIESISLRLKLLSR